MTIISTTVGKNPLEKNGVAIIANKRVQNEVLGGKLKNETNDLCSLPKQTIQYHSYPSLCPNHWCQRSWSLMVLWWPTRPSRMNIKKDALFSIQDWNAKEGSQEVPGVTGKFSLWIQNEEGQILTEFFQENTLVIANTFFQQHKTLHMDTTRFWFWSKPKSGWLCSLQSKMEKLYTVSKNKTGSWLWFRSWTPYCQIHT